MAPPIKHWRVGGFWTTFKVRRISLNIPELFSVVSQFLMQVRSYVLRPFASHEKKSGGRVQQADE
jgi:hypothetical protein